MLLLYKTSVSNDFTCSSDGADESRGGGSFASCLEQWVVLSKTRLSLQDLVTTLELSTKDAELFLSALDRTEDIPEAMTVDQTELTIAEFLSLFTYETAGSGGQSETPREPVTVSMKDCGDGGDQVERLGKCY